MRKYIDKIKPQFMPGGRFSSLRSVFEGFETFLYVPNETRTTGAHIHDAIDSKRIMSFVVIALMPALLLGMYNVGYQNALAAGQLEQTSGLSMFIYGAIAVVPKIIISYLVGLGIEFAWAQWKGEEIQEGYLVTGIIIPMILPVGCPLWVIVIAVAFAVIFGKEIFGGTGMNIFNVALLARAFLFFSYPTKMSGDQVWVSTEKLLGVGYDLPDGFTMATPLGEMAQTGAAPSVDIMDAVVGLIPGSIGETSVIAIALGALLLLATGIASWKTMLSVFIGGTAMALLFDQLGMSPVAWYDHLVLGGFCFGAVFMATDPVTSARTETGKWIYGVLIGALAIIIRVMNPGYPEGMMLAILFGNMMAPTIDYYVVEANISRRRKRVKAA